MNNVVSRYAMIVQGFSTFVFMQFFSAAVQDLLQCYFLAVECYYSVLLSLYPKVLITCVMCPRDLVVYILARLILTPGATYKDALWLEMFLFIYKSDLPKKKFFFFATTG